MPHLLHVDMDAFYAAVAQRDDPSLRGKPIAVGGGGARGVVMSASYEARARGVRNAMPTGQARQFCPELIVVGSDFATYHEESAAIRAIFEDVTPLVEPLALDEAFLDVGPARRRLGDGPEIGQLIRGRIREERRLTASVGVATVKFLAKIASRKAKPDGLFTVPEGGELAFLHPLPVGELWGVGAATQRALQRLGIGTVAQLAETPLDTLAHALGTAAGGHLHDLAHGRDPRPVEPDVARKSVSSERTFDEDITDPDEIDRQLLQLGDEVGSRLRHAGHAGRTVGIKVRRADRSTITRARTLETPTDLSSDIVRIARELFTALRWSRPRVRLLGVGVSGLVDGAAPVQLKLEGADWSSVEATVDAVRDRFGAAALVRARLQRPGLEPL